MTRMPDLERELVAAAQRRYGKVPRRRPSLGGLRLLAPLAAVLVVAVVAAAALRVSDPEVEAPTERSAPPAAPTLVELREGPLGPALAGADPGVVPVTLRAGTWTVAAWAEVGGYVCQAATTQQAQGPGSAGRACDSGGTLGLALEPGGASAEMLADDGEQLVYGLAQPGVERIVVEFGGLARVAELSDSLLEVEVTEAERRAVRADGGEVPPAGPVSFRLFAASFPDGPEDSATLRVHFADGRTATVPLPVAGPAEDWGPDTPCFREASLDSETAVPGGEGTPLEVCRRFWRQTGFEGTPVPDRLTVCRGTRSGAPYVFPGGPGVCARLGLEPDSG